MVIVLYFFYLTACAGLTVTVGFALARSGRVVMTAVFGDERLAEAVSRSVVLALYLLNFGYVALTLGAITHVTTAAQAEALDDLPRQRPLRGEADENHAAL